MPATGGAKATGHAWRFVRAGGFDQVRLDRGSDLAALGELDQKLWVALSCPTRGLEFDGKTLELIDADGCGRIRPPEILAATAWACAMLKDPDELIHSGDALPLAAINDATAEGRLLLESARHILTGLGRPDATTIRVEDTTDTARIFAQMRFNGDGVVPAESADDEPVRSLIRDIIACLGGEADRSGREGVTATRADQFFAQAAAFADWWARADNDAANVLPLGGATAEAAAALAAVRAKVDDYFVRCRLAAFDPRATGAMNRQEADFQALAAKDLTATAAGVAALPLARVEPGRPLPLKAGVNPAWVGALAAFGDKVVRPLVGDKAEITEGDWAAVTARFAGYEQWAAAKAGAAVEPLGPDRVRQILAGNVRQRLADLIARDQAVQPQVNAIAAVDKLVRYHRDLFRLLNNFVCFRDFYAGRDKATFQAGTLYLDQRSCDLCVRVQDVARHAAIAHLSRGCLVYCDLTRKNSAEKMTIVAAFTAGDSDNLMVGRNGIFYDRQGHDWDATIVRIVANPISIRQAFFSPYKRVIRWIEELVAKRAAAADASAVGALTTTAMDISRAAQAGAPGAPATPPPRPKFDVGVIAALGVAVGGITAALGALLQAFFGLGIWMPLGLVALVLLISGPSMMIAWLKLRQRNLGPILDANGWAVNARARINLRFGRSLTRMARLPPGSRRELRDPYAERTAGRNVVIAAVLLLAAAWALWHFGIIQRYAPDLLTRWGWGKPAPTSQPADK